VTVSLNTDLIWPQVSDCQSI